MHKQTEIFKAKYKVYSVRRLYLNCKSIFKILGNNIPRTLIIIFYNLESFIAIISTVSVPPPNNAFMEIRTYSLELRLMKETQLHFSPRGFQCRRLGSVSRSYACLSNRGRLEEFGRAAWPWV